LPFFDKEVGGSGAGWRGEGRVCEGRKGGEFVRGANGRERKR